jgi:kinesin family protein 3/17
MGSKTIVEVDKAINQVIIRTENETQNEDGRGFTFDAVYGADSTQRSVYDEGAFSLVESVMAGYNGTIFAYG